MRKVNFGKMEEKSIKENTVERDLKRTNGRERVRMSRRNEKDRENIKAWNNKNVEESV
ncbi:MAG: hypothetical protein Harvfovirus42_3 [Harvfovirus sp.]|uniref:Uncharacterized protein n=1 Tax=Harvfovirus sp. TaxID=2487768 RepID=A0A3G5A6U9_9VIRU|nr:MAG: hypothetical protein Harvfovirus42_3 [Harvfovirus sp.]